VTRGAAPNTTRPRDAESRLIDALTSVCARDGYANATVERVLAAAGVSRASFYYHFSSIEDCFLSAYRVHSSALLDDVASAPATCSRGELAAIDALVGLAARRPDAALLLFREVLAAGEPGLSERRALIAAIERASGVLPPVSAVDLPSGVLLGGVSRFLAMRLTSAPVTEALADELHVWAAALTRPTRSRTPDRLEPSGTSHSDAPAPGPAPVAATLPVASAGSTRERLLLATAATVAVSGYRAATVADIVAAAGVSRRVFYRHFDSRRDAFAAAYEYAFARAMAAGACLGGCARVHSLLRVRAHLRAHRLRRVLRPRPGVPGQGL
jgi:AcrR family transcriptional regulator